MSEDLDSIALRPVELTNAEITAMNRSPPCEMCGHLVIFHKWDGLRQGEVDPHVHGHCKICGETCASSREPDGPF